MAIGWRPARHRDWPGVDSGGCRAGGECACAGSSLPEGVAPGRAPAEQRRRCGRGRRRQARRSIQHVRGQVQRQCRGPSGRLLWMNHPAMVAFSCRHAAPSVATGLARGSCTPPCHPHVMAPWAAVYHAISPYWAGAAQTWCEVAVCGQPTGTRVVAASAARTHQCWARHAQTGPPVRQTGHYGQCGADCSKTVAAPHLLRPVHPYCLCVGALFV